MNLIPQTHACKMLLRANAGALLVACALGAHTTHAAEVQAPVNGEQSIGALPSQYSPVRHDDNAAEPSKLPRGQAALTVGLPISPENHVAGELAVDVRYGHKFWWIVPYVAVGFRQLRLDPLNYPWEARNRKLRAWHITAGARLEIPVSRKLLPFVGIGVEEGAWMYTEDSTSYCHESWYPNAWRCYKGMVWSFGQAVKPQLGLVYKPERSLGLEFWIEYIHVVDPDMFTRNIHLFCPSLGLAWHH